MATTVSTDAVPSGFVNSAACFAGIGPEVVCSSPLCIRAALTLPENTRVRRRLLHELICKQGDYCSINHEKQGWLDATTVYVHAGPQLNKTQQASDCCPRLLEQSQCMQLKSLDCFITGRPELGELHSPPICLHCSCSTRYGSTLSSWGAQPSCL